MLCGMFYMQMTAHTDACETYHTAYPAVLLRVSIISVTVFSIIIHIQTGLLPITSHKMYLNWECQVRDRNHKWCLCPEMAQIRNANVSASQ